MNVTGSGNSNTWLMAELSDQDRAPPFQGTLRQANQRDLPAVTGGGRPQDYAPQGGTAGQFASGGVGLGGPHMLGPVPGAMKQAAALRKSDDSTAAGSFGAQPVNLRRKRDLGPNGNAKPPLPPSTELDGLLKKYEARATDTANVGKAESLQQLALRGAPTGAAQFEASQQGVSAKIARLPQADQDYYRGGQAAFINYYETADTTAKRDAVVQHFGPFSKTLDGAVEQAMRDPAWRAEKLFDQPYGTSLLDMKGRADADGLAQFRAAFHSATNAEQREQAVANGTALKGNLQQRIGQALDQSMKTVRDGQQNAERTILGALEEAKAMRGSSDANNPLAFKRLELFGGKVFTSESNARAFKAMQQERPTQFAELGQWEKEAADKTAHAQDGIQSDPFKRRMAMPDVPAGYLAIDENTVPLAHYGEALLAKYKDALTDVKHADDLYHAEEEGGPIKEAYIRAHTAPKPEWQQQAEEVFCRLTVGNLPGVGLLTDQICPRSNLSPDARTGVDIVGGVLGGGEAALGEAGRMIGKAGAQRDHFPTREEAEKMHHDEGKPLSLASGGTGQTVPGAAPPADAAAVPGPAPAKPPEAGPALPRPAAARTGGNALHVVVPQAYVQPQPDMIWNSDRYPGLMEDRKGNAYVVDGKAVYALKQDKETAIWSVYDPQAASRPAYPIQPDGKGGWEFRRDAGIKGGMLGDGDGVAGPSAARQAGAGAAAGRRETIAETANRWVADQDRKYTSITKKYKPRQLNLGAYEHKLVQVSDKVYDTLTSAQKINETVNALMPYGSGNQHWDIVDTQGGSFKRVSVSRMANPDLPRELVYTCAGAGNCGEKADLALKLAGDKFTNSRVMQVRETNGVDHTYVVVGDNRESGYGASAVVIDPWPSFPTAHILGEGVEKPEYPPVRVAQPGGPDLSFSTPMEDNAVDSLYGEMFGKPTTPNSVLLDIRTADGRQKFVWTQPTSGNDMSTKYVSPSNPGGITIDKLPDYIVERYDPYIRRDENQGGTLIPQQPPNSNLTDADIQRALDNLNAGNGVDFNFSDEQMQELRLMLGNAHPSPRGN